VVLLTATFDRKYACRRCWATIQATRKSTTVAAFAGAGVGLALLVPLYLWAHKLNGRVLALPSLLGVLAARLFPRFEVIDSALQTGQERSSKKAGAG
jgi:hypothetical protein